MSNVKRVLALAVVVISVVAFSTSVLFYLQINDLQTTVSSLQSEVSSLETQNLSFESQVATLQSEVTSLNNDKIALESEVTTLNNETTSLESQVSSLNNEKTTLESQVENLQSEVATLDSEKASLESEVSSLQSEVTTLKIQVSDLQSEIATLENEVIQSYDTGYAEGESAGYQLGYDEGYTQGLDDGAGTGYTIRDPTYAEAIAFIASDTTDENTYTVDYTCFNFAADFEANAFQAGYRAGFVYMAFGDDTAHAIVCFNVTGIGIMFIEPQTDEIVTIAVGQYYLGSLIEYYAIVW